MLMFLNEKIRIIGSVSYKWVKRISFVGFKDVHRIDEYPRASKCWIMRFLTILYLQISLSDKPFDVQCFPSGIKALCGSFLFSKICRLNYFYNSIIYFSCVKTCKNVFQNMENYDVCLCLKKSMHI